MRWLLAVALVVTAGLVGCGSSVAGPTTVTGGPLAVSSQPPGNPGACGPHCNGATTDSPSPCPAGQAPIAVGGCAPTSSPGIAAHCRLGWRNENPDSDQGGWFFPNTPAGYAAAGYQHSTQNPVAVVRLTAQPGGGVSVSQYTLQLLDSQGTVISTSSYFVNGSDTSAFLEPGESLKETVDPVVNGSYQVQVSNQTFFGAHCSVLSVTP